MSDEQKTLLLTGASRGIGHATVKRFSAAGWRVLTVSRHAFSPHCPWEGG
ncbi:SDR family NAD(P)-dependent oxidoreductase, partial [Streptomyces scabiei]